jgi:hypothetical protein
MWVFVTLMEGIAFQEEKSNVGLRSLMWVFNLKAFNPLGAFVTLMWVLQVRC